jgi:hypothetical protein
VMEAEYMHRLESCQGQVATRAFSHRFLAPMPPDR